MGIKVQEDGGNIREVEAGRTRDHRGRKEREREMMVLARRGERRGNKGKQKETKSVDKEKEERR